MPVGIRNEQTARPAIKVTEQLAGRADHRRVDDGRSFLQVLDHEAVKKHLVGVLQLAQVDVLVEIADPGGIGRIGTLQLRLQGFDLGRQQPVQTEQIAFLFGEGSALVEERMRQQALAGEVGLDDVVVNTDDVARITAQRDGLGFRIHFRTAAHRRSLVRSAYLLILASDGMVVAAIIAQVDGERAGFSRQRPRSRIPCRLRQTHAATLCSHSQKAITVAGFPPAVRLPSPPYSQPAR